MFVCIGCKSFNYFGNKGKVPIENQVIRYVNLNALYSTLQANSQEFKNNNIKRKSLINSISELENTLLSGTSDSIKLLDTLKKKRNQLQKIEKKNIKLKAKYLNKINVSIKKIAKKLEVDFILNIGDEVVYAKRKYDVTEDVLREIYRLEKRSAPVSR